MALAVATLHKEMVLVLDGRERQEAGEQGVGREEYDCRRSPVGSAVLLVEAGLEIGGAAISHPGGAQGLFCAERMVWSERILVTEEGGVAAPALIPAQPISFKAIPPTTLPHEHP